MVTSELLIATTNMGKVSEFRTLLAGMPVQLRTLRDCLDTPVRVIEDGATFEANAIKKARVLAESTRLLTLADDSGLEVDALGGLPGVRSARFSGEGATDSENNATLLRQLEELISSNRLDRRTPISARFRCVLALIDPLGDSEAPTVVEGRCEGKILLTPRGGLGFGYDPLFEVEGTNKTLAEMTSAEKNAVSHRSSALTRLRPFLAQILAARSSVVARVANAQ